MNPGLDLLQPYPFERLAALRANVAPAPGRTLVNLSIGEPQHATPPCIHAALTAHLDGTARYPATRGLDVLRETICTWASHRFGLHPDLLDPARHVLPVNGTREALFAVAQAVFARDPAKPLVGMPNPFYQIYEGAALLAGATPCYLPCPAERGFRPDWVAVPESTWRQLSLVYVCSPGNPSGAVLTHDDYATLVALADRHDFVIVADECYSELYLDEHAPPLGLLEWCASAGRDDFARCLVMHSLSKRSNAPGLRSGFVAGDAALIEDFFRYRTYQGGAMALPVQHASIAAWSDEQHVIENRALYRAKFVDVVATLGPVLDVTVPPAGFYLWPALPCDDIVACERLLGEAGVLVLPGQFLAREAGGVSPGRGRIRIALVAEHAQCVEAATRMADFFRNF
ncbi:MAG: succinyldiaminopimelate transaminase [Gammaproteobacteria bacterium]